MCLVVEVAMVADAVRLDVQVVESQIYHADPAHIINRSEITTILNLPYIISQIYLPGKSVPFEDLTVG